VDISGIQKPISDRSSSRIVRLVSGSGYDAAFRHTPVWMGMRQAKEKMSHCKCHHGAWPHSGFADKHFSLLITKILDRHTLPGRVKYIQNPERSIRSTHLPRPLNIQSSGKSLNEAKLSQACTSEFRICTDARHPIAPAHPLTSHIYGI